MLKEFQKYIDKEFPELYESKVLLTVSGGIDSIVMMHLFKLVKLNCAVAHCNFQMRGKDSDGDENFVKSLAKKAGIKFHSKKFETKKFAEQYHISTQMAARKLRYEWFDELCEKHKYDFIATAHHQTDVAETLIINQLRRTGLSGMHGILPLHGKIIRPLLFATRDEIFAVAKSEKLQWREDSSNADDDYVRNKIRQKVLPVFKEINPGFEKTFSENANHFYEAEILLNSFLSQIKKQLITADKNNYYINIKKLLQVENAKPLLFFLLRDFGFKNNLTVEIYESLNAISGKKFFSSTHQLIKNRDDLIITKLPYGGQIQHTHYEILEDDDGLIGDGFSIKIRRVSMNKLKTSDIRMSAATTYFDAAKISFPLQLRRWKKGDYFHPAGMMGKRKKLSDYFIDEKFSLVEKDHIWLLLSGAEICWVIGKRSDERFKITHQTKSVLQITFTNTNK